MSIRAADIWSQLWVNSLQMAVCISEIPMRMFSRFIPIVNAGIVQSSCFHEYLCFIHLGSFWLSYPNNPVYPDTLCQLAFVVISHEPSLYAVHCKSTRHYKTDSSTCLSLNDRLPLYFILCLTIIKGFFFCLSLLVVLAFGFIFCRPCANFSLPFLPSYNYNKCIKVWMNVYCYPNMTDCFFGWHTKIMYTCVMKKL